MYERKLVHDLLQRMQEDRHFIQVVVGPRQTGKTTAIGQMLEHLDLPSHFVSADEAMVPSREWLRNEWQLARRLPRDGSSQGVLVIDEVHRVPGWPSTVKALWDEDTRNKTPLKVVLSGSSPLLHQKGMQESLMGRFEVLYSSHWGYQECRDAFGYDLEQFLFFGGYPGAAALIDDIGRWLSYMGSSIIEPTISQDALANSDIRKPALLRALFNLGASYSAQELSYTMMLGQLQDAGNTTTLTHYLELLSKAGMLSGLQKYSPTILKAKGSSPRLMVHDTSLMTASYGATRASLLTDPRLRGYLVETAVGAFLLARGQAEGFEVSWWRERDKEVDFVLQGGRSLTAIEVKSGRSKNADGIYAFLRKHPEALALVIDADNLERFLLGQVALF